MLDDRSPIYRQIAEQLREDIVSGAIEPGERIMSTNEYAVFHRINPATAAKAFQQLVADGLLEKRRGIGMFVTDGARDRLLTERRARFASEVLAPVVAEAQRLGISLDELIDELRRQPTTPTASSPSPSPGAPRRRAPRGANPS